MRPYAAWTYWLIATVRKSNFDKCALQMQYEKCMLSDIWDTKSCIFKHKSRCPKSRYYSVRVHLDVEKDNIDILFQFDSK